MKMKPDERKAIILNYVEQYYREYDRLPSERDIVIGTHMSAGSVHRFLIMMRESGELLSDGSRRSIRTREIDSTSDKKVIPLLGYVACGPGQEEEEQFMEYIHISESLLGKGDFFALIAKGESMVDVGVRPGDYVIVRRQQTARNGDLIIALLGGKNNLKKLVIDDQIILRSCNKEHAEDFPDIIPEDGEELTIQGVAVGVYHGFE